MLRLLFALLIPALAVLTAPRPIEAAVNPEMKCCAHMSAQHHCAGEKAPAKSQDESSCCNSCALGLAFLLVAPVRFVYPPWEAEEFFALAMTGTARFDSPPVPPPRA